MRKTEDYKTQLQRLYQGSIVVYLGLAILAGFLMGEASFQLTLTYLAKDDLLSKANTVFAPASHAFFDIQMRWVLVVILVLSAVVPALYQFYLKKRYEQGIKNKSLTLRWIDMAITAALMVEVIALLSGIQDLMILKIIGGVVVISCLLGWLAEKQYAELKKPVWTTYILSLILGVLPWLLIITSAIATPFYSSVRAPWYLYALYAVSLITFIAVYLNQYRFFKKVGQWKDYLFVERNYLLISLFSKITFALVLIIGLRK